MSSPQELDELEFEFVGVRKAARGDWFFGPMGALFPWTHGGESEKVHRCYRLKEAVKC